MRVCTKYQIHGKVKSSPRKGNSVSYRILKQCSTGKGYLQVNLCKYGAGSVKKVHRLVCEAFIPNPDNLPQVNHINGIKSDNNVENLEWCTNSENQLHAYNIGLQKHRKHSKKTLLKISKSLIGKPSGMLGKKHSKETKEKMRISRKKYLKYKDTQ